HPPRAKSRTASPPRANSFERSAFLDLGAGQSKFASRNPRAMDARSHALLVASGLGRSTFGAGLGPAPRLSKVRGNERDLGRPSRERCAHCKTKTRLPGVRPYRSMRERRGML